MQHRIVSRDEWLDARRAHLAAEKELTRARDALAAARRELPWVRVEKTYTFATAEGPRTLADLFDGRSQLIINHFMLGPGWTEGCIGCSFGADHIDGSLVHLLNHDVSLVTVSRAPLAEIEAYKRRMGWQFPWVSSGGSDFNYDFGVSFTPEQIARGEARYNFGSQTVQSEEMPGVSVFCRGEDGAIYHTYSTYGRGDEQRITTYAFLDMTPKGRNETGPHFNLMDWVKRHDSYQNVPKSGGCCHS
jgi:predicted dithiol-disulfide oxidoreductase (DUF899 family)